MEDDGAKWKTLKLMYTMFYASLFSKRKFEIDLIILQMASGKIEFITDSKKLYVAHLLLKKMLDKMQKTFITPTLKPESKKLGKEILEDLKTMRSLIIGIGNDNLDLLHTVGKYLEILNKNLNDIIFVLK